MELKTVLGLAAGFFGASSAFLFGEWTQAHTILVALMTLDFITGLIKAAVNKEISSRVGYKGLMRKSGMLLVLIVANFADIIVNNQVPLFASAAVFFYIAMEAISLLENLKQAGVELPEGLTKYFSQIRDKNNK